MLNQHNLPRKVRELKISDIFTINQTADITGIGLRTLYRLAERGEIKPITFINKFCFDRQTVNQLKKVTEKGK